MLPVVQFCRIVQFAPSNSHHLQGYGAVPFVAVAVNVIGVPVSCGAGWFGVRLDSVSGSGERNRQRAVAVLPAASRAVIVITFEPL